MKARNTTRIEAADRALLAADPAFAAELGIDAASLNWPTYSKWRRGTQEGP